MIRDPEVLQPEVHRFIGHFFEGVMAVGSGGVVVESASEVLQFDKAGKGAVHSGLDLATVLAELRWDECETKCTVNIGFFIHVWNLHTFARRSETILVQ